MAALRNLNDKPGEIKTIRHTPIHVLVNLPALLPGRITCQVDIFVIGNAKEQLNTVTFDTYTQNSVSFGRKIITEARLG